MVKACSTCKKHKRVCKVHARSGKCNECVRRGQRCDIQVSRSEFDRLRAEKEKLLQGIADARRAQEEAHKALEAAHEASRTAFAKEMRLRQQMDLVDRRADDAIAVEVANIEELEEQERQEEAARELSLNLSPTTWSALDGLPEDFFVDSAFAAFVDSGGTASEVGGSS